MGTKRKGLIGSIQGDLNSSINRLSSRLSNSFDQRISGGLKDLLTGITGIRTSNIPEISAERLSTIQTNREARQNVLNNASSKSLYPADKRIKLQFPQSFPGENGEEAHLTNFIHFRCLPTRAGRKGNYKDGQDPTWDIFLYVPDDADSDTIGIEYSQKEKTLLGSLMAKLMTIGEGTDQGIGDQLGQGLKEAVMGDIGKAAAGQVTNPMKFQLFEGVKNRTFSYTFALLPKNITDAKEIRKIAYAFKRTALPGIKPDTASRVYEFPNEWAIRYHGPIKGWIDYPMACVLSSVKVDNSSARMSDGAPIMTTLVLEFTEVMNLDRNKYDDRVSAFLNPNEAREKSQEGGSKDDISGRLGTDVKFKDRKNPNAKTRYEKQGI